MYVNRVRASKTHYGQSKLERNDTDRTNVIEPKRAGEEGERISEESEGRKDTFAAGGVRKNTARNPYQPTYPPTASNVKANTANVFNRAAKTVMSLAPTPSTKPPRKYILPATPVH